MRSGGNLGFQVHRIIMNYRSSRVSRIYPSGNLPRHGPASKMLLQQRRHNVASAPRFHDAEDQQSPVLLGVETQVRSDDFAFRRLGALTLLCHRSFPPRFDDAPALPRCGHLFFSASWRAALTGRDLKSGAGAVRSAQEESPGVVSQGLLAISHREVATVTKASTSAYAPQAVNPFEVNRRVLASDLNHAAKAVLLIILDHARHGQSVCTASTQTIAREAKVSERHVRNVLPELQGRGLIVITRATGSCQSRHTITVGPCLHQVGNFRLRVVHVVGNGFREVGNPAQPNARARDESKDSQKDGFCLDDGEEIDPQTTRWFGHLLERNDHEC